MKYDPADPPHDDRYLASVARYFIDGGEDDVASLLLACSWQTEYIGSYWRDEELIYIAIVTLRGPRAAHIAFEDVTHSEANRVDELTNLRRDALIEAMRAVLPNNIWLKRVDMRVEIIDIDAEWRTELLEIARGRNVHNQVVHHAENVRTWMNLRFRSATEIKIAEALDRKKVMFIPNAWARVNQAEGRVNREPDFLICHSGKWGVLEVDGETFHPPSRTAQDHERDRLFKAHGVKIVEHYDSTECFVTPDKVIAGFLDILSRS